MDIKEKIIREMYDSNYAKKKQSIYFAKVFDISELKCGFIISAKNQGFESKSEYEDFLLKRKDFQSRNEYQKSLAIKKGYESLQDYREAKIKERGYSSLKEYQNELAIKKGFKSKSDQLAYCREQRGLHPTNRYQKDMIYPEGFKFNKNQNNFEIELRKKAIKSPNFLKGIPEEESNNYSHIYDNLYTLIEEVLNEREKDIILRNNGLMGEDKITLTEIAEEQCVSRSMISFINKRAYRKIRIALDVKYGIYSVRHNISCLKLNS